MKTIIPRLIFVLILILAVNINSASAQVLPGDSALIKAFETDELLPLLIDSAIKYSGLITRNSNSIDLWKENEKIERNSILNGISFVSAYNYGTTGDLTVGQESGAISQFSSFRNSKSARYNVGINLQLPLGNLLSRKSMIRTTQIQAKIAEGEKEGSILFVKQEVIRLYQDLKLAQRLLVIGGKGKQVAFVNYSLAEKQFLQVGGDLDQYTRLQDVYNKSAIEFESYLNRFQTSYMQLQMYTNTNLANLIAGIP